jgi:hypothetical protein
MSRALLAFSFVVALPRLAVAEEVAPDEESVAGGEHWRIDTQRGPIHVWRPAEYDRTTAGVVIYVHGHFTTVDKAWKAHSLPAQFAASHRNALFIAPEAPTGPGDDVSWVSIGDLVRTVRDRLGMQLPPGPLVVVGHSGAYRTIVPWLDYVPLDHVILLDAMYGSEEDFRFWVTQARGHGRNRLTIVAEDTLRWTRPFVERLQGVVTAKRLPDKLSRAQLAARILYLETTVDHMAIVTGGKVIPLVLARAPLPEL